MRVMLVSVNRNQWWRILAAVIAESLMGMKNMRYTIVSMKKIIASMRNPVVGMGITPTLMVCVEDRRKNLQWRMQNNIKAETVIGLRRMFTVRIQTGDTVIYSNKMILW